MDSRRHNFQQATAHKHRSQFLQVRRMSIRDKRTVFIVLRTENVTEDVFLPAFGLFVGEYCIWHILTEHARHEERQGQETAEASRRASRG